MIGAITGPVTGPTITSAVTEGGGGASLSAFSAAKFAIQQDAADVNILVIGDSTGNETTEWVYLFGQWLESECPTHAVSYRLWNDTGNVYDAAVSLGTGTGSRTIRIWNASINGSTPTNLLGDKFAPAIGSLSAPDLVIWSHGHNCLSDGGEVITRGVFLSAMEMVRQAHPSAAHAMIVQNPHRDDTQYDYIVSIVDDICSDRGDTTKVDVHAAFIGAGKSASLYSDNTHPNAAGQQLWLSVIQGCWRRSSPSPFTSLAAWLDSAGANLLTTSNPVNAGGTLQSGWLSFGTGTVIAADAVEFDEGSTYSTKVTTTAAAAGVRATLSAANRALAAGNNVTLAVRQKIPTGAADTCGRVQISWTGGNVSTMIQTRGQGGWRWSILSAQAIPAGVANVQVSLYGDTAASAGSIAYYDRAVLVVGDIPRDMA